MNFPRDVIRIGTERQMIEDGYTWIDMLTTRNSSTHEYNEQNAREVIEQIQKFYFTPLSALYEKLRARYT